MSVKPESSFIKKVHGKLPAVVYREKTHNAYRGGTPDVYYSAPASELWVEYKYIARIPVRANVVPDLSALQQLWLKGRYAEGRNVAVIVGCPDGGVIYQHEEWLTPLVPEDFRGRLQSVDDLAKWITAFTCGGGDVSTDHRRAGTAAHRRVRA